MLCFSVEKLSYANNICIIQYDKLVYLQYWYFGKVLCLMQGLNFINFCKNDKTNLSPLK